MRPGLFLAIAIALLVGCTSPANPGVVARTGDEVVFAAVPDAGADDTVTISPHGLDLVGTADLVVVAPISITGNGATVDLGSFEWSGDGSNTFTVAVTGGSCTSSMDPISCSLPPGSVINPGPLGAMVSCKPSATPRSATLKAVADTGVFDSILVTCKVPVNNPSFSIPNAVPVSAPVGGMTADFLRVTNDGDTDLTITAQLDAADPDTPEWDAGPNCVTAPCALPVGGHQDIPVLLHPTRHGSIDTQLVVQSTSPAVGPKTATLEGIGVGGDLRVDQPTAMDNFDHDFGTIAKNQTVAFTVQMTNIGNDPITVSPSTVMPPFAIVANPPPPIVIGANNGTGAFDITCFSATALGEQTTTVNLSPSANTYTQNTDHVTARCAVADTTVQVTNPLAFGEKRVGDPEGLIDVMITNPPGGGPVDIVGLTLVAGPPALSLDPVTTPVTLADGQTLETKLHLATTDELASLGDAELHVDVMEASMVTLKLPITGRVAIAQAVVTPTRLDLGSVCVGTGVAGEVTMTNTGSATLLLQPPAMDSISFVPLFTKPTEYPMGGAMLVPMDKAMAGVMPAVDAKGQLDAKLTWLVDIPAGKFEVPVSLHVLDDGTAVSPGGLEFGSSDIEDVNPMPQTIRIENCGPDDATVRYDHVVAIAGEAGAWVLDPPSQERTLLKGEEMRVRVAFVPRVPGVHVAQLPIAQGSGQTVVTLTGDATGTLPDKTSFYACNDCNSNGAPTRGWPIVAGIAFALRRRRRRTC